MTPQQNPVSQDGEELLQCEVGAPSPENLPHGRCETCQASCSGDGKTSPAGNPILDSSLPVLIFLAPPHNVL